MAQRLFIGKNIGLTVEGIFNFSIFLRIIGEGGKPKEIQPRVVKFEKPAFLKDFLQKFSFWTLICVGSKGRNLFRKIAPFGVVERKIPLFFRTL